MRTRTVATLIATTITGIIIASLPVGTVGAQRELSLTFYGDPGCSSCVYRENVVEDFVALHPEVGVTYVIQPYYSNASLMAALLEYLAGLAGQPASVPALVLNDTGDVEVWFEGSITAANLEAWLQGLTHAEDGLWVAFLAGLLVGVAPCLLLMASVLGTTLVMVGERRKYLEICVGVILGIIVAYALISVIFLQFLSLIGMFAYFKYAFAAVLVAVGVWQIVEFKKEKSAIFGTPAKVKGVLRSFAEKRSGIHAFLLGVLFAFVKTPCFGGIFLSLLYDVWLNPLLVYYILVYFGGMLLPLVALLVAIRVGIQP
ncbi:MAG: hypothetical protein JW839_18645, partial [Candidatus Lokiarchaeota archaeon]|nr:hypothetical protein [Candidatus Lokiarchaeota archaeon]